MSRISPKLIDDVRFPICRAISRISRVQRCFFIKVVRKFLPKISKDFRRRKSRYGLRMELGIQQFIGLSFDRVQEIPQSGQGMLLSKQEAAFDAGSKIVRNVLIDRFRHFFDRLAEFRYRRLQLEILLLKQRSNLFGGVGPAGQSCLHDNTSILLHVLTRGFDQRVFGNITDRTETEEQDRDEDEVKLEQFHSCSPSEAITHRKLTTSLRK